MEMKGKFRFLQPERFLTGGQRFRIFLPLAADLIFALLLWFYPDRSAPWIILLAAAGSVLFLPSFFLRRRGVILWGALLLGCCVLSRFFPLSLPALGMSLWIAFSLLFFFRCGKRNAKGVSLWLPAGLAAGVSLLFLWRSFGSALPDLTILYAMSFTALFFLGLSRILH